jgi:hypothetical protein
VVATLLATLATPRSAADTISDECGLASVYSTVSEETASGEDTLPADFTAGAVRKVVEIEVGDVVSG